MAHVLGCTPHTKWSRGGEDVESGGWAFFLFLRLHHLLNTIGGSIWAPSSSNSRILQVDVQLMGVRMVFVRFQMVFLRNPTPHRLP